MTTCALSFDADHISVGNQVSSTGFVHINRAVALRFSIWELGIALSYETPCCGFAPMLGDRAVECGGCDRLYSFSCATAVSPKGAWAQDIEEWLQDSALNPLEVAYVANVVADQTAVLSQALGLYQSTLRGLNLADKRARVADFFSTYELEVL